MFIDICGAGLAANIGDLVEWESVVCHLIALIILTVGLYLLLFKPVKRMIRERQEKIRKIEKENSDLNAEVRQMKENSSVLLSEAKKQAATIHENAVKSANQKADEIWLAAVQAGAAEQAADFASGFRLGGQLMLEVLGKE